MIDFKPLTVGDKAEFDRYLANGGERGCEYSFANLFLWGRQRAAVVQDHLVLFSQFNRRSVYPYPVGVGDKKPVLDAIMEDAVQRGIPCRLTGLTQEECAALEQMYPGQFRIHCDRDGFDYIYAIDDLADLKGRKYQKKRNHLHRFRDAHPDYTVRPLEDPLVPAVNQMIDAWYAEKQQQNPKGDYHMERSALRKALANWKALGMEALVLMEREQVLAMTMGSFLSGDTFDVNFEKAAPQMEEAYPAINWEFARYLREKYPQLRFLNREDDLGIEGLRKAKLSYYPDHLVEKCWACLLEDGYDY